MISERLVGQDNFLRYLHIEFPRPLPHVHGAIVAVRIIAHEQLDCGVFDHLLHNMDERMGLGLQVGPRHSADEGVPRLV